MGSKYEVMVFGEITDYEHRNFWRGESFIYALWNMIKAKRKGVYGCVTLYWR